ncbi:hypothetical protein ACFQWF_24975 [Methylorubrum suomiense]
MGVRRGPGRPRRHRLAGPVVSPAGRRRARGLHGLECGGRTRERHAARGRPERLPLDLVAAGFRLVYLSEGDGSAGRLAGYEGRHGCRLAVWSRPSRGQAGLEIAQGDRDLRVARWDSKGRRYVLLSETVPAERFALLAEVAVLLTEPTKTDRLRLALDRATGLSERPCTG